jgi:NAD+ synthase (glutamine-hydrolysing)
MKKGFLKVCAATPTLTLGDCTANGHHLLSCIETAAQEGAGLIVFPELCVTGYSCGDLFFQSALLEAAEKTVAQLAKATTHLSTLIVLGAPIRVDAKLYNAAVVLLKGRILGIVPKMFLPNYNEFYEKRWFSSGLYVSSTTLNYADQTVPFSPNLLFKATNTPYVTLGLEICEDLWAPLAPSTLHTLHGATLIANLSASNELIGKAQYRKNLIAQQSARSLCSYVYASSGIGESTTDVVFSGHKLIYENGYLLAESDLFATHNDLLYAIVDTEKIYQERLKQPHEIPPVCLNASPYEIIEFVLPDTDFEWTRPIDPHPFVPHDERTLAKRCQEIFAIQSQGLAKRMTHIHADTLVIGISGGLDSTLALLVAVKAAKLLNKSPKSIIGITMPGFGTTDRTYQNALTLMQLLGITTHEISIVKSTLQHLADIDHDLNCHNTTYENAQARERTQILMDFSNKTNGLVVGTGDLSELALGWATYNGDHMSMYGVNASIPKTLVRHLVNYVAHYESDEATRKVLLDILDTPVSPELLPPDAEGAIAQKTEDLVGPYELHDFYLYYILRFGYSPDKVYFLARQAFKGIYEPETLLKWLKVFYRRFFSQQFKRSCLPDGPKVGSVCLSPRGDWRMPSDAHSTLWLEMVENLSLD